MDWLDQVLSEIKLVISVKNVIEAKDAKVFDFIFVNIAAKSKKMEWLKAFLIIHHFLCK